MYKMLISNKDISLTVSSLNAKD